jgi:diacylglycerol kinase (ATP)
MLQNQKNIYLGIHKRPNMELLTKPWFVIANPVAGNGRVRKRWARIEAALREHLPKHRLVFTSYSGEAIELAAQAIREGCRHLIAVGGDGTNNEVINGIFQQQEVPPLEITYTLLPVGTGNDWIKTHGISHNLKRWIEMLRQGNTFVQDVGVVRYQQLDGQPGQRYFANVAGMAYDAYVARYSAQYGHWVSNKIFYLYFVVRCLFQYRLLPARVRFDGQTVEDFLYTVNVGICRYSGGGMLLVPHAEPDDGQLALTIARRLSKLGVLLNTYRFYTGTIGGHPRIDTFQVKNIEVESVDGQPTLLEADGEFLGQTPAVFGIVEKALRVVVP